MEPQAESISVTNKIRLLDVDASLSVTARISADKQHTKPLAEVIERARTRLAGRLGPGLQIVKKHEPRNIYKIETVKAFTESGDILVTCAVTRLR